MKTRTCAFHILLAGYARLCIALAALSMVCPSTWAQDPSNYLLQTGKPSFSAIEPFPSGFVNLSNGNMHIEIPLGSFTQRGSNDLNYKLVYDSRIWLSQGTGQDSFMGTIQDPNDPDVMELPFFGWSIAGEPERHIHGTPYSILCTNGTGSAGGGPFDWRAPDGTTHHFDSLLSTGINCNTAHPLPLADEYSVDGAGYHLFMYDYYPNIVIYAKDGSLVYADATPSAGGTQTSLIEDPNGNKITWTYPTSSSSGPKPVVDTLGRSLLTSTIASGILTINVLNSQNTYTPVVLHFGGIGVLWPASNCQPAPTSSCTFPDNILESITLADGSSYTFTYDCDPTLPNNSQSCNNTNALPHGTSNTYGLMTSMTLPSGGAVQFSYTNFADADTGFSLAGVTNRWLTGLSYGGGQWSYIPATGCGSNCQTVTVARPSGAHAVYTFFLGTQQEANNTQIDYYDGAVAGTPALTITSVFEGYNGAGICPQPAVFPCKFNHLKSTTALVPSPAGVIRTQTTYGFDSFLDSHNALVTTGKLISRTETHFGLSAPGPVLRQTSWQFLDDSNPNYRSVVNSIQHNIMNRVTDVKITDAAGNAKAETTTSYDANLTALNGIQSHDDTQFGASNTLRGNATAVQQLVGGTTFISTANVQYDTTGQVIQVTDPAGHAIGLGYQDRFYVDGSPIQNPPATISAPSQPTNAYLTQVSLPLIGTASKGYYLGSGKQAVSIDQNGADTYEHYADTLDRATHTYSPSVTGQRGWTLTTYGSGGTQADIYQGINDSTASSSCSSCFHRDTLDALTRLVQESRVNDPDSAGPSKVAYSYDSSGRTLSVSNPYRTTADSSYGTDTFSYDSLGRPTQLQHADGSSSRFYYGASVATGGGAGTQLCATTTYGIGYPTLIVDEAAKKRQSWVDALGRTIETDEPDATGALSVPTCYSYDVLDNLNAVAQGSVTRTYSYDDLSRSISITDPESGTVLLYYTTAAGALCSGDPSAVCRRTDARGIVTTYAYDALNRLVQKTYSDGVTPTASYHYDETTPWSSPVANPLGRMTSNYTYSPTTGNVLTANRYSYDAVGRILFRESWPQACTSAGATYAKYSYDLNSDPTTINYGQNSLFDITYSYQYDVAGRISGMTSSLVDAQHPATLVSVDPGMGYFANDAARKLTLGNGLTITSAFNNGDELCRVNVNSSASALSACTDPIPSGSLQDFNYSFGSSNNGNITNWSAAGSQLFNRTYTYDQLNRLATMTDSAAGQACKGLQWTYDSRGNRTDQTVTNGTCNTFHAAVNAKNQLVALSGPAYVYDPSGNLTGDGVHTYTYDAENRLTQVDGGGTAGYVYDAEGNRVVKNLSGTTRGYLFGASGEVLAK